MRLIYPDVANCRALIIDGNPSLRSMQALMLRDMGVGTVVQCSRASDARRVLESRQFDIVLCDYHFDGTEMTGQELLDDLRRAQLLQYSTVFIMVTNESSYARVAEAAETALDSYLLKPHTALALEERLIQARHRKTVLRDIFEAVEADDFVRAATLCRARFEARDEYWLYAARIGAELYIRLGEHETARTLYLAVEETKALPWARLGVARSELEGGQIAHACSTLESLIGDQPAYADAYDVMGRVQIEQGDLTAALETYRSATRLTPHSISRLQRQGMLAFYMGSGDEAAQALERCVRIGMGSKMFDCQSLLLLALMHFDRRDSRAFQRNHDNLSLTLERHPDDMRTRRFVAISSVFKLLNERQVGACVAEVRRLVADIADESFDFEAASNLLAMLSRLRSTEVQLEESAAWISRIARRFCVSKVSTEMLCRSLQEHEPSIALVREGHAHILKLAEQAMAHSVNGSPGAAVKSLMVRGAETLNAKLVDLAGLVLTRHAAKIDGSEAMALMIEDLKRKFCGKAAQVNIGGRSGARAAGALTIRA